ncbi:MAG: glycosyltransferase family 2 protein [Candidatus Omnitrophota bacterium]
MIVPVYNREDVIEKCLKSIRSSAYRDYELIVVDCGSTDNTVAVAGLYADRVIELAGAAERSKARNNGFEAAQGEVIVNIDSDVLIRPDTLGIIEGYLRNHPEADALTGCLAKEHPHHGFFSQYKNLYMHYNFSRLPARVSFLYGSLCALRRSAWQDYKPEINIAEDTELGQRLAASGKKIAFLRELEVAHLKKYDFLSFIKNDFVIPFHWARLFIKYKGWEQLGRNKTGFAHVSLGQLAAVVLAPLIFIFLLAGFLNRPYFLIAALLTFAWYFFNFRFLKFLAQEKGVIFGSRALFITFLDNIAMALGIAVGLLAAMGGKF